MIDDLIGMNRIISDKLSRRSRRGPAYLAYERLELSVSRRPLCASNRWMRLVSMRKPTRPSTVTGASGGTTTRKSWGGMASIRR